MGVVTGQSIAMGPRGPACNWHAESCAPAARLHRERHPKSKNGKPKTVRSRLWTPHVGPASVAHFPPLNAPVPKQLGPSGYEDTKTTNATPGGGVKSSVPLKTRGSEELKPQFFRRGANSLKCFKVSIWMAGLNMLLGGRHSPCGCSLDGNMGADKATQGERVPRSDHVPAL